MKIVGDVEPIDALRYDASVFAVYSSSTIIIVSWVHTVLLKIQLNRIAWIVLVGATSLLKKEQIKLTSIIVCESLKEEQFQDQTVAE